MKDEGFIHDLDKKNKHFKSTKMMKWGSHMPCHFICLKPEPKEERERKGIKNT